VSGSALTEAIDLVVFQGGLGETPPLEELALILDADHRSTLEGRFGLLAGRLGLDPLEQRALALVVLPDLSPELGTVLAGAADGSRRTTPRFVARALGREADTEGDVYRALAADGTLRTRGALRPVPGHQAHALPDRPLAAADPVLAFLLAAELGDPTFDGRLRRVLASTLPLGRAATVTRLRQLLALNGGPALLVHGPDAALVAAEAAGEGGAHLVGAADVLDPQLRRDAVLTSLIDRSVLIVDRLADVADRPGRELADALAELPRVVLLAEVAHEAHAIHGVAPIVVDVPTPDQDEREAAWRAGLGDVDGVEEVARRHRLPVEQIAGAVQDVAVTCALQSRPSEPEDLFAAARHASAAHLGETAERIEVALGWDDLVLPARPLSTLQSLGAFLRHRDQVLGEWGFGRLAGRDQGLVALFTGASGTGKTLAARVLAGELGLELFRVDLSTMVSKWIGETERNLDRIFTAAAGSSAVLLFDEADAIFGKRSGVEDSKDRYANLGVAYLLQRLERHDGPVVLATNLRGNIDEAFTRRFDAVIEFPTPDEAHRRRLWSLLIPADAPMAEDVDLDFLAERFDLSGGGIRNAALAAAVLAAEAGTSIGMEHLTRAVAFEYAKLGRLTLAADFGAFHALVRGG
jgi:hypothetical protein